MKDKKPAAVHPGDNVMNKRPADWSVMKRDSRKRLMAKLALLLATFVSRDRYCGLLLMTVLLETPFTFAIGSCPIDNVDGSIQHNENF